MVWEVFDEFSQHEVHLYIKVETIHMDSSPSPPPVTSLALPWYDRPLPRQLDDGLLTDVDQVMAADVEDYEHEVSEIESVNYGDVAALELMLHLKMLLSLKKWNIQTHPIPLRVMKVQEFLI